MTVSHLLDTSYWGSLVASPWIALLHLLDIAIVIYMIYQFSRAIAGTKIMTLIRGVFLFVCVQLAASLLGLQTISWLLNQVITYGVIAAVVIFAPELRAVLEKLGRTTQLFTAHTMSREEKVVDALVQAAAYMAPRKIGALVAIERSQTLQQYRATGIELDAAISRELLINIFIPNTPLHDGAVIIKDNRVATTCAYLPLSEQAGISKEFGTRHRAAIGLSEVSDALVLVVSEETGSLSLSQNGTFRHGLTLDELKESLEQVFLADVQQPKSWWQRLGGGKHAG